MATAFAQRERSRRELEDTVQILTGGTHPAEEVHPEVIKAMAEIDIDLSDRVPQKVSTTDLNNATVVATMGCSTLELDADVEVDDWALEDPHGQSLEEVRRIRDEIEQRVSALFDEYTSEQ
jgi:protein-tyrosine-phosphatase